MIIGGVKFMNEEINKELEDALKILSMIMLRGDAVDCMAAAKNKIRKVVSMLEKEVKTDG